MNFAIFSAAFGSAWTLVANLFSKVPFLSTFLTYASGPLGSVLGPIVKGAIDAVTSIINFVFAYIKVFADGLTITAKNLSVLAVIFTAFVGGVAYGIHIDRTMFAPKPPQTVKAALTELHKNFVCYKRK